MTFSPPPGWPVPRGWTPPPGWEPDPGWPPAPAGWSFWVGGPEGTAGTFHPGITEETPPARLRDMPAVVVAALTLVPVLALVVLAVFAANRFVIPRLTPHTAAAKPSIPRGSLIPDWPAPGGNLVDFSSWTAFGGVDARFGDDRRSVLLDTHDSTQTWRTKWSGLIQSGPSMCALHIRGRARDVSHAAGVPGGFGIGLATLSPGNLDDTALTGMGIQFDFGQQGYRFASYPDDSDEGLTRAPLDNRWHEIEVSIDNGSHALSVDGQQVASAPAAGQCGHPTIRVWAGEAEFADFSVL
jgi:hypothetical protein